jgi:ABC-type cobalamin/Fe3+-siderophores transport system ATPase subunit
MRLTLTTKVSFLDPFTVDLPDLAILTGINGAGKTQLLTAIRDNQIQVTDENNEEINPKKYVTSQTLLPNESAIATREQLNFNIPQLWSTFNNFIQNKKQNPNLSLTDITRRTDITQVKIIEKIIKNSNKNLDEITYDDFLAHYPLEADLLQTDIFHQNFSSLFKRYQDKFEDNEYRQYRNEIKNYKEINFLSKMQFISSNGEAPWDFVNKIIAESKLDYHVNSPVNSHRDEPFILKLVNSINGAEIRFSDLSSGEKVLMSLAFALYNLNFDIEFPKVLLMDEPDASLHPSMSKQFLEVIQKVFVFEKKVKVIITTHSPSTVALAPEESIFIVNKTGERIEKATKDKALRILTSGVPSFSVNYENRRQVFVESPNDVLFYEKIYQKISNHLIPEISLSFISSGESKTDKNGTKVSNCGQVINITNTLREKGNKFVWGIIDWDLENKSSAHVKVLGNGNRHSIENYLFDPILVAALLLRERLISRDDLYLKNNETYTDFKNLDEDRLQVISDFVIQKVSLNTDSTNTKKSTVKLLNGLNIDIPVWYLHHHGHQLEEVILKSFPELNSIKKKTEELLKLEIINKIIDDIPELISSDFVEIYKNVQTVD